jgi:polysaccharide biosynthesis/export protein
VLRPGDYALRPGMRISELMRDNIFPEQYARVGELTRLYPPDYRSEVLYFDLGKASAGDPRHDLELQEFDDVRLFSRWEMEELPKVKVTGEVQRPGEYSLLDNMTVRELVMQAGNLKTSAFLKAADIRRVGRDGARRSLSVLTVNLEEALRGSPQHNLVLENEDELLVRSAPLIPEQVFTVAIRGQVRRPGQYRLNNEMTVRELVAEAGGPTPLKAYLQNAEISRLEVAGGAVRAVPLTIDLEEALAGNPAHNLPLAPYDELFVRTVPDWMEETDRYVTLKGEVRFPGSYPIYKGERLSSVLQRAGGFTDKAYLRAAKFTRKSVQEEQQRRMEEVVNRTEEDLAKKQADLASTASSREELEATKAALEALTRNLDRLRTARAEGRVVLRLSELERLTGGPYDVELMAGDSLEVPQSSSAVSIMGEVYNPTTLLTLPNKPVQYYLGRAGGPTREAAEREIYVIRADGSLQSRQQTSFGEEDASWFKRRWGSEDFMALKLDAGDTVVVPRRVERIAWMREIKDITQILANVALAAGVIVAAGL